jgi:hypothetical protein
MPSEEAARTLLDFFQAPDASGEGQRYTFAGTDTRFLGDLYQDLSASVRERYALLQTPHFVEQFILDQTLDPAIERFGLSSVRLLDPTCGSGHFLLGAFDRLFEQHQLQRPALEKKTHAAAALSQIYGCDLNPYAVAIARFRLTLAFLEKAGLTKLHEAPPLKLNLVVADSLLYGAKGRTLSLVEDADTATRAAWGADLYNLEDPAAAKTLFRQGYHAVVGNPPYITCKDSELREHYRTYYKSAAGKYALAAPFTECFFHLAVPDGYVGLINANSFMKREFGKKLIEEVLPRLDLQRIIDTSGAFIPGHGTPTVLLFGQNRAPLAANIPVVMGKRGEPAVPEDAEQGVVWRSIAEHYREPDFENEYISTREMDREVFGNHPWSLGGGGVGELQSDIEQRSTQTLKALAEDIGFASFTGLDEVFILPNQTAKTASLEEKLVRTMIFGEFVRDWSITNEDSAIVPYDKGMQQPIALDERAAWHHRLWPHRVCAESVTGFGGKTRKESGENWWEWYRWQSGRYRTPLRLTIAFIATHNHVVLDRGGNVFSRTAPIITLKPDATEDDHLALLGYLNSSLACFWMKQVCFDRGNRGEGGGTTAEAWERFYEFTGTKLEQMPIPTLAPGQRALLIERTRQLLQFGEERQTLSRFADLFDSSRDRETLHKNISDRLLRIEQIEHRIRGLQESLDWFIYSVFGLADASLSEPQDPIAPGARASDVLFAREVVAGGTGRRYFELCRLPAPDQIADPAWSERWNLQLRLAAIAASPWLQILETPVYKRTFREGFRPIEVRDQAEQWLLSRCEEELRKSDSPRSVRQLAGALAHDPHIESVTEACITSDGLESALLSLIPSDSVPYLAALRYSDSGMDKRRKWEQTWALQRRQDAGEEVEIEVPPKYDTKDFRDPVFYRLRGKLDVPKERFIRYPGAERDDDRSPLIGWAGWDHLQRATALAALYHERKTTEGWDKERLVPLLAGVLELVPWLKQWHNEPSPEYGNERLGDYFASFVEGEARGLGVSVADLVGWRPQAKGRGRGRAATSEQAGAEP